VNKGGVRNRARKRHVYGIIPVLDESFGVRSYSNWSNVPTALLVSRPKLETELLEYRAGLGSLGSTVDYIH
jgi:hypothetical protein